MTFKSFQRILGLVVFWVSLVMTVRFLWLHNGLAATLTGVLCVLSVGNRMAMVRLGEKDVLQWLTANPGWHFGLDMIRAGVSTRGDIYIQLSRLEQRGLVERRDEPSLKAGILGRRPLFRAVMTHDQVTA